MITKADVLPKIRKKYKFFECPKRDDRVDIPEQVWNEIVWTEEERYINAALPHHMWNRRQDDRPWPLCKQFRGKNAIGPRAGSGHDKFFELPPKLVKGRGISRWMSRLDRSVLEIPLFADYDKVWTPDNIPDDVEVWERKPGTPDFGKKFNMPKGLLLKEYGPSSLQKFSDKSKLLREPFHFSYHKMLKRREVIGQSKAITGADKVFFTRVGGRWDSLDDYIVKNAVYTGLAWN